MKKKLLATLAVLTTLTILTACGSSDKKEASQPNNEEEADTMIVVRPDSELEEMEELEEDLIDAEGICSLYYDYSFGLIPEDEYSETLEAVFETNPDNAKAIFEEHGEEYGYKIYEMSEEILNSKLGDQIMQIGDVVVHFPCTVGELIEATSAELIAPKEAADMYRAFHDKFLYSKFESLETLGDGGNLLLQTSDGSVLYLWVQGDGELHRATELYISQMTTGSNNVFIASGIHTGLSMEEIDSIFESNLGNDMSHGKWRSRTDSVGQNPYLTIGVSTNPDRDWERFPSAWGDLDEIVILRTDAEGASVYYLETRFSTPYDN